MAEIVEANSKMKQRSLFSRVNGRKIREYLTGYLFIAPAVTLIFIFGIFPVGFALYVSLHKWRLKQGAFIGLKNYVSGIGNLAYLAAFILALLAFVGAYLLVRSQQKQGVTGRQWLHLIPALVQAGAVLALLRWGVILLPEFLGIADKLRKLERTQEVFMRLLGETLWAEQVAAAFFVFISLAAGGLILGWLVRKFIGDKKTFQRQSMFAFAWTSLAVGGILIWFTFKEIAGVYAAALEAGTDPGVWPQVVTIGSGFILIGLAWLFWKSAEKRVGSKVFWWRILAAFVLMVGGWLLIGEIPTILASGDPDLWEGLKVTIYFSMFTVPFQLAISLFLSVLLFQKIWGSNAFRIIYFLPYVTPAVASAAIFRQIFSARETAPANLLLKSLGAEPLRWLFEPKGVFSIIANGMGVDWPAWAAGPSLALTVIILHSVWTYVGYDTVIYLAGLGNISKELIDAAAVDGANKWDTFWYIIFPLLSPTTYFLSLIAIIGTFKAFSTIWIFRDSMALGTTDTFSVTIFIEFFEKLRYGYASALSFVLFAIILILTVANNRIQGSRVFYG
ncbi:MAG: ABC transporter permease subunit [Anaerolineaceae bacterium]|jgi:ABC-type sugar transport system permease subunit|nr:ABC transporter permease subunit [Anaerolineaceae bacterium]